MGLGWTGLSKALQLVEAGSGCRTGADWTSFSKALQLAEADSGCRRRTLLWADSPGTIEAGWTNSSKAMRWTGADSDCCGKRTLGPANLSGRMGRD
jgi:hypothetical protein